MCQCPLKENKGIYSKFCRCKFVLVDGRCITSKSAVRGYTAVSCCKLGLVAENGKGLTKILSFDTVKASGMQSYISLYLEKPLILKNWTFCEKFIRLLTNQRQRESLPRLNFTHSGPNVDVLKRILYYLDKCYGCRCAGTTAKYYLKIQEYCLLLS